MVEGGGYNTGVVGGRRPYARSSSCLPAHARPRPPHACAEQGGALPGSDAFWRFNRTQDYGNKGVNETAEQLKATFS